MTEKFTFDLDFDEERVRLMKEHQVQLAEKKRLQQEEEREAAKLRYTPEQIEQIKQQAHEEGKQVGLQEAKQSQEKAMLDLLTNILNKVRALDEKEQTREKISQRIGIETAFNLLKKISPSLVKGKEIDDVNAVISQAFTENPDQQRLVVRVHDSVLDHIVKNIDNLVQQTGFSGKPIVLADQSLNPQDCKIEWADGGMERMSSTLWQGLEKAVNHVLTGLPEKQPMPAREEEAVQTQVETEEMTEVTAEVEQQSDDQVEELTRNDTEKKEEVSDE